MKNFVDPRRVSTVALSALRQERVHTMHVIVVTVARCSDNHWAR